MVLCPTTWHPYLTNVAFTTQQREQLAKTVMPLFIFSISCDFFLVTKFCFYGGIANFKFLFQIRFVGCGNIGCSIISNIPIYNQYMNFY